MPGKAPLFLASSRGDAEECARLIREGGLVERAEANPEACLDGWTPLIVAARKGYDAVVRVLLDHGASIDLANTSGRTSLYIACLMDHAVVVRVLLDHGASIDQANNNGATPLYIACQNEYKAVVRVLLDHRASLEMLGPLSTYSPA